MSRLIGYGAYNLCFDRDLGVYQGVDFFTYLRDVKKSPVNLVKVICYRNAALEGLAPVPDPAGRTIPLYTPEGAINKVFLGNLAKLVRIAREKQFTVEICIFSYHSVARREAPEYLPAPLANLASLTPCERERKFFSLNDSAIVDEQVKLVRALVTTLRDSNNLSNVIWEIANEVRVDTCGEMQNVTGNCDLVMWLNHIARTIRDTTGPLYRNMITTSTGVYSYAIPNTPPGGINEKMTFAMQRPADGCSKAAFIPGATLSPGHLFDLHRYQWNVNDNWVSQMRSGIRERFGSYGYGSGASFIINTDGMPDAMRTPANIRAWATEAFRNGHHFASKEWYPPHDPPYNEAVLDALAEAARV